MSFQRRALCRTLQKRPRCLDLFLAVCALLLLGLPSCFAQLDGNVSSVFPNAQLDGNVSSVSPSVFATMSPTPLLSSNTTDTDDENSSRRRTGYTFLFIRFIGIELLLCWPCYRAIRVWWMAGGRIKFRWSGGVDENGRGQGWIVGLRHIPPDHERLVMLIDGRVEDSPIQREPNRNHSTNLLTAEQVYSLPEIEAPGCPSEELHMVDVHLGSADELAATYHGRRNDVDIETNLQEEKKVHTTTMSTSCSICLEDFEAGEKVRLLPLCGHAFHTECILPWLTERQGYCPYCKHSPVIPSPVDAMESNGQDSNDRRSEG